MVTPDPKLAGSVCTTLASAIYHGTGRLESVPGLLRQAISGDYWRSYALPGGGPLAQFDDFLAFVEEGLRTNVETLQDLCRRDPEALGMLEDALTGTHQGPRQKEEDGKHDQLGLTGRTAGKGRSYALGRLLKNRPDLYDQVLARELSARRAMVDAGLAREQFTVQRDPERAARTLRKRFDKDALDRLIELLRSESA